MLQIHSLKKPQLSYVVDPYKIPTELQRHTARIRWEKNASVWSNFLHPCIFIVIYASE